MAELPPDSRGRHDAAIAVLWLLYLSVSPEQLVSPSWRAWAGLPLFLGSPRLPLLGLLLCCGLLLYGLSRLLNGNTERGRDRARFTQAALGSVLGFSVAFVLFVLPGMLLVLGAKLVGWPTFERAARALAFCLAYAGGGLWAGWRFGRAGVLCGVAGVLVNLGVRVLTFGSVLFSLTGIPVPLMVTAVLLLSGAGGHIGAAVSAAAASASAREPAKPKPWPLRPLFRIDSAVLGALILLGVFHQTIYPAVRNVMLDSICHSPVDLCAGRDGRLYVLSSRETFSSRWGSSDSRIFVFD